MMNVRAADRHDLEHLTSIWFTGWHDAHAAIVPEALSRLRTYDNFRDRLRNELHAVRVPGEKGSPPVGFTMLRGGELYQFYVDAPARGSGIATVLMRDAEAQMLARDIDIAWLACAVGNLRAARFYEKCGWRRAATVTIDSETSEGPFPLLAWRYERHLR